MGYIYIIRCTKTSKAYIGQTIKPLKERLQGHFRAAASDCVTHLCRAIRKHGKEAFVIELLEECDDSLLNEREEHWIQELDTKTRGYNETWGGEGVKGYKHNHLRRQRMRLNHWSRGPNAEEIRTRINTSRKGWHPSPEVIEKTASKNRGKKRSLKTRQLQSLKASGPNNPMYGKPGTRCRSVSQFALDGTFIASYPSIKAAIESLGVKSAAIAGCCEGRYKTSHGFVWKFTSEVSETEC